MTSIRRTPLHQATVTAATLLTRRMRRITVAATSLEGLDFYPAQDVELVLAEASGRRVKRRYTIRHQRRGELDLDVLLHGDGPGSHWGATAEPGSSVQFFGPRGKLRLTDAATNLFLGDESSLPAIAALIEALRPEQQAIAYVEVNDTADEIGTGINWVHRNGHPAGTPDLLKIGSGEIDTRKIATRADHAYLLGESRSVVALRAHLVEQGLDNDKIFTKGYWNAHTGR